MVRFKRENKQRSAFLIWALFGILFSTIGAVLFSMLFIQPMLKIQEAKNWIPAPCVILRSSVETHSGDESDTYSINIAYEYFYLGDKYYAEQYSFNTGSDSLYKQKRMVVDTLRPGVESTCFVNPENPHEAVINRGLYPGIWFGLMPLAFLLFGLVALALAAREALGKGRKAGAAAGSRSQMAHPLARARYGNRSGARQQSMHGALSFYPQAEAPQSSCVPHLEATESGLGDIELKPGASRRAMFVGVTLVALFWNGITWLFVFLTLEEPGFAWWSMLFMLPFILVGLALFGGVIYTLLALFNPKLHVRLKQNHVRLGDTIDMEYRFEGRADRITRLTAELTGEEKATYRVGTDTRTDTETFYRETILDSIDRMGIASGSARFEIPRDAMHTLHASNNKICWTLKFKGAIDMWPDVSQDYELDVLPLRLKEWPMLAAKSRKGEPS